MSPGSTMPYDSLARRKRGGVYGLPREADTADTSDPTLFTFPNMGVDVHQTIKENLHQRLESTYGRAQLFHCTHKELILAICQLIFHVNEILQIIGVMTDTISEIDTATQTRFGGKEVAFLRIQLPVESGPCRSERSSAGPEAGLVSIPHGSDNLQPIAGLVH